ncbi:MAG: CheB methylesterase domain-containing protein, partial [Rhodospirillales bacterium]|nr:CheB methylesterase domain-containing protein [Rhodospirillales bacterium]
REGEPVLGGTIYIAPGARHMEVACEGGKPVIHLTDAPPENFCRPAADPMLRSMVKVYGGRLLLVVLTGMGADGRKGAEAITRAGGTVIAQDEPSSVVWGMPGAVATAGLCTEILPLTEIAPTIGKYVMRSAA